MKTKNCSVTALTDRLIKRDIKKKDVHVASKRDDKTGSFQFRVSTLPYALESLVHIYSKGINVSVVITSRSPFGIHQGFRPFVKRSAFINWY